MGMCTVCGQVVRSTPALFCLFIGKEGDRGENAVFHRAVNSVEKISKYFRQTVDKFFKVCYNGPMMRKMPDFEEYRRRIEEERETYRAFYELLMEYNQRFNLTSVTGEEEVFHKHFLDSVAGEYLIGKGRVVAVGSGAGFPSIPIAILRDDLHFTLIESTGKKCEFLKTAARELGLSHIEVVCARAEDAARGEMRESFDVCIARAVARLNTLSEYCLPLVKRGGAFIAWKSDSEVEFEEAKNALEVLGGRGEFVRYELPQGYGARMLVRVEKIKGTPKEYPRGRGMERRKPL